MSTACACCLLAPPASATADDVADGAPRPEAPARHHGGGLDDRVRLLSAELGLDAKQQAEVRQVLERQREQMSRAWSATAVPPAYRVSTTRAISARTADQIRALLTEAQRRKYIAPKPPHVAADDSAKLGLDYWMDPARSRAGSK
jgi:hypothetical protein